jgi:hypothetical protein
MRVNYQQVQQARSSVQSISSEIEVMISVKAPKRYIETLQSQLTAARREAVRLSSIWVSQNPMPA